MYGSLKFIREHENCAKLDKQTKNKYNIKTFCASYQDSPSVSRPQLTSGMFDLFPAPNRFKVTILPRCNLEAKTTSLPLYDCYIHNWLNTHTYTLRKKTHQGLEPNDALFRNYFWSHFILTTPTSYKRRDVQLTKPKFQTNKFPQTKLFIKLIFITLRRSSVCTFYDFCLKW